MKSPEGVDSRGFDSHRRVNGWGLWNRMGVVMENLVHLAVLEHKGRDQGYPKRKSQLHCQSNVSDSSPRSGRTVTNS